MLTSRKHLTQLLKPRIYVVLSKNARKILCHSKKEKMYQIQTYSKKSEEVKTVILRYIFGYYNTQRVNSFNEGEIPPVTLRTSKHFSSHAACYLLISVFF